MASKVVKQLAGDGSGQSLSDMMTAFKHTIGGSPVLKIICKATTEEMRPPKMKHLSALIAYTFQPQLSIPHFANGIIERTQHSSLVVVFKSFITMHRLMQSGHECFFQYIASNNCRFNLVCLNERNPIQTHGLHVFAKVYGHYLEEKARSYCDFGGDLCRLEISKDGDIRTMSVPKLFKMIPIIERLLDAVVAFDPTENDLANPLLRVAHFCLYRDLIHLCAVHNAAMITILGNYFTMSKRDCQTALNLFKSFMNRSTTLNKFIKLAGKMDSSLTSSDPESSLLKPFPPIVLESLEQHLASLKNPSKDLTAGTSTAARTSSSRKHPLNDVTTAPASRNGTSTSLNLTTEQRRQIIEEERERLESFVHSVNRTSIAPSNANSQSDRFADKAMDQLYANYQFDQPTNSETDLVSQADSSATNAVVASDPLWSFPERSAVQPLTMAANSSMSSNQMYSGTAISQATSQPTNFDPFSPVPQSFSNTPAFQFPNAAPVPAVTANRAVPVASSNPFMPATSQGLSAVLMPTNNQSQPMPSIWSVVPAGVNHTNAPALSLDDRIAELASNLAIVPKQSGPSEVDWSAAAPNQPRLFAPPAAAASTGSIRNSSSANQLTGPAVQPASGLTNPWGHYPQAPNPAALRFPAGGIPPTAMNSWQAPMLPTVPVQQPAMATSRSTNPFL